MVLYSTFPLGTIHYHQFLFFNLNFLVDSIYIFPIYFRSSLLLKYLFQLLRYLNSLNLIFSIFIYGFLLLVYNFHLEID